MSPGISSSLSIRSMAAIPLCQACEQFSLRVGAVRLLRFDAALQFGGLLSALTQVIVDLLLVAEIIRDGAMNVGEIQRIQLPSDFLSGHAISVVGQHDIEAHIGSA